MQGLRIPAFQVYGPILNHQVSHVWSTLLETLLLELGGLLSAIPNIALTFWKHHNQWCEKSPQKGVSTTATKRCKWHSQEVWSQVNTCAEPLQCPLVNTGQSPRLTEHTPQSSMAEYVHPTGIGCATLVLTATTTIKGKVRELKERGGNYKKK